MTGCWPGPTAQVSAVVISSPDLGVFAVAAAGILCAFSCGLDALPEWCLRRKPSTDLLLAQQLLSAGERVLDVPPKLGARVRLLAARDVNKNDPSDARSVAVAALRSPGVREVRPDDHAALLKVWMTCAASMPSCAMPGRSSRSRSPRPGRA